MEDFKSYVFYMIKPERNVHFGIQRGYSTSHENYWATFVGLDSMCFTDAHVSSDWHLSCSNLAVSGNVMFVNSALEQSIDKTMFLLYLPSYATEQQIVLLEEIEKQIKDSDLDVAVFGKLSQDFFKERNEPNFDSHAYLETYIKRNKLNIVKEKVMNS